VNEEIIVLIEASGWRLYYTNIGWNQSFFLILRRKC